MYNIILKEGQINHSNGSKTFTPRDDKDLPMFKHLTNGLIAANIDQLDDFIYIADLHGVGVSHWTVVCH